MKNYYEILEVSEKASPEVIEKAYKALVKKYHPDLQPDDKKQEAENRIKEINEAYDILSNTDSKSKYDEQFNRQRVIEDQRKYDQTKNNYQNNTNNSKSSITNQKSTISKNYSQQNIQKKIIKKPKIYNEETIENYDLQNQFNKAINEAYNNAYTNAYNQAYINTLKSMGYDIKYEKTFKQHIKSFSALAFVILALGIVGFILWHIQPIKNYLIELYSNNDIIRILVDIIRNIIASFSSLFTKL